MSSEIECMDWESSGKVLGLHRLAQGTEAFQMEGPQMVRGMQSQRSQAWEPPAWILDKVMPVFIL